MALGGNSPLALSSFFRSWKLLGNRYCYVALGWLLLQQTLVASSTVWITHLIGSLRQEGLLFVWLSLYLASLILPYAPGMLALINMTRAQVTASTNFLRMFCDRHIGCIDEWADYHHKEKKTSILAGEGTRVIDGYYDYLYHLSSTGLNVTLNLIVLSVVIDYWFLVSYALGIFLALTILRFQKNKKHRLSIKAQQSRIKWNSLAVKAWDNVILNNLYNLAQWNRQFLSRTKRYVEKSVILERFSQIVSFSMAFALMFPSFLIVIYLYFININDDVYLAMMTVVLPRLFSILSFSYDALFLLSDLPLQQANINTVLAICDRPDLTATDNGDQLLRRIQWNKISAIATSQKASHHEISARDLLGELPPSGRIMLRGENGTGKTTLLLLLKSRYKHRAFYLPVKHGLLFRTLSPRESTGQQVKSILNEIRRCIEAPILLLDEWDANLDANNCEEISRLIDEMALKCCVIESRHRKIHSA